MRGPARTGALIYAKDLERLCEFGYSRFSSSNKSASVLISLSVTCIFAREDLPSGNNETISSVALSRTHLSEKPFHSNRSVGGA